MQNHQLVILLECNVRLRRAETVVALGNADGRPGAMQNFRRQRLTEGVLGCGIKPIDRERIDPILPVVLVINGGISALHNLHRLISRQRHHLIAQATPRLSGDPEFVGSAMDHPVRTGCGGTLRHPGDPAGLVVGLSGLLNDLE